MLRFSKQLLHWLTAPRVEVPLDVRAVLLEELLSSPNAVGMAMLNGIIVDSIFLFLHYNPIYVALAIMEALCGIARSVAIWQIVRARSSKTPLPIAPTVLLGIVWCLLQGCTAFAGMSSGDPTLQILSATLSMALIGPISAINYPAPRLAFLFVCLCSLPFVAATCLSGYHSIWILLVLTPPFLYSCWQIIGRFHRISVDALVGKQASAHLARHDTLTGLGNRLAFTEMMERLAVANEASFALLCLDLDGFKNVNDTFGHHTGDALLQSVARRLEACMRPDDVIVRLGGDEFVIVADRQGPDIARTTARRIEQAIASRPFLFDTLPPLWIGVSVGFACAPQDGCDPDGLHRAADHNLYKRKTERRQATSADIIALRA